MRADPANQAEILSEFSLELKNIHCLRLKGLDHVDADIGQGKGTGPWDTQRVRKWMERLKNVKKHYISGYGLCHID